MGVCSQYWSNQGSLKEFLALKESFPEIYENPILINVDDEVEEIPTIEEDDLKYKEINSNNNNEGKKMISKPYGNGSDDEASKAVLVHYTVI